MSAVTAEVAWTLERFLAWEREQSERHEFIGGRIYLMTRPRVGHARRAASLSRALAEQIAAPCEVFVDGPLLVAAGDALSPDVMVVCSQPDDEATEIHDAEIVIEVLSPSNRPGEMLEKRNSYLSLPSLVAYLVVDGEEYEAWTRIEDGPWQCASVPAGNFTVMLHGREVRL